MDGIDLQTMATDLFGVMLTPEQVTLFETYLQELIDWNTRINLTSIVEPEAVRVKHFLDSLSVIKATPVQSGMRLLDVGSGAGFPGIPLHISITDLHTTLLESTGKKITFLDHIVKTLKLESVKTLNARAEDAGHLSNHRAQYDLVLARAVARLPVLLEYMLPFARVGGRCVAMKGASVFEEIKDSENALKVLGGQVVHVETVTLPGIEDHHYLAVIEKTKSTPGKYPRQAGIPSKKPLSTTS